MKNKILVFLQIVLTLLFAAAFGAAIGSVMNKAYGATGHPKDQWFVNNHNIRRFVDAEYGMVCYITDYSVSISCVKIK